jgi:hypothetical protein
MMTDNGHDGSMLFTIFQEYRKDVLLKESTCPSLETFLTFSPRIVTIAQGNGVGQISGIGAVSGGKNWGKKIMI